MSLAVRVMHAPRHLALVLLSCLATALPVGQGHAQDLPPIRLSDDLVSLPLGSKVEYFRDVTATLGYHQVREAQIGRQFQPGGLTGLNFGFTNVVYWYRFTLRADGDVENQNWVLEISWPPLDTIDLYITDEQGHTLKEIRTGDTRPPGSAGIPHRNYAIPLTVPADSTRTVHARVQIEGAHQLPLTIWQADAFHEKTQKENLLYGMFYGVVAVMVAYNLLIFISIRDLSYLYYILFIFWLGVVQLTLDGFAFPFIWELLPGFVNKSLSVFIALSTVFVPLFVRSSLQTSVHAPRLARLLNLAISVAIVCVVLPFFVPVQISVFINVLVAVVTTLLVALVILVQAVNGHRTARFYVLVWGALVIGIVAKSLQANGLLPITFVTTYAIHIGLCLLVTLVSLGLGDQINRERRERERMAHQHELAETRAKLDFIGKMSHELRTPMNAIMGFTRLALQGQSDEERRAHLGHINEASRSMRKSLDAVLSLSQVDAGAIELSNEPFSLDALCDHVMSLSEQAAKEKGLEMSLTLESGTPLQLVGDVHLLEQVLINLLENAVKFTDQGNVFLRVRPEGFEADRLRLRFEVEDSGIGLSKEQIETLFEPFVQGDQSLSRRYGGSGLGLVICKELLARMGSRIQVESVPAEGSRFFFTVLLDIDEVGTGEKSPAECPADFDPGQLNGVRALVVDDNLLNRRLAGEILQDVGAEVAFASNGQEAIDVIATRPFDVVLMDLQMPVMDGLQATRSLRAMDGFERLPVIAMTANALNEDRRLAEHAGMTDFLTKPIDAQLLYASLARWVTRKEGIEMVDHNDSAGANVRSGMPGNLPGMNLEAALKRLGGRQALLLDLLREFIQEQSDMAQRFEQLLAEHKTEDAIREAHSIKGMAANVGCDDLSESARLLELALKEGRSADVKPCLDSVVKNYIIVSESLTHLPDESKPMGIEGSGMDDQTFQQYIAEIMALIASNDFSVQEKFEQLQPALAARVPSETVEALAAAIRDFDFEKAAGLLNECL